MGALKGIDLCLDCFKVIKIQFQWDVWVFNFSLYNFLGQICRKMGRFHVLLL